MNEITKRLLKKVTDFAGSFAGAYNIREDGGCAGRRSTPNIAIESKKDNPGIEITVKPGTRGEKVYIPACVTKGGVDDLVYNDFFVGEGADVTIIAGCGVHTETGEPARHSGVHRFIIEKDAKVRYVEKHVGAGSGEGGHFIDPVTEITLKENAHMEIDTSQIGGVDFSRRHTEGVLGAGATLLIRERLLTEKSQKAETYFKVELNGENSSVDLVSRSVARDHSRQEYESIIIGNAPSAGHSECDAIIDGDAVVDAAPKLFARHRDAALVHEAAIGKIAGEQILKLCTLGLTEEEAEAKIIEGFLR